jgi:hypothetical protein
MWVSKGDDYMGVYGIYDDDDFPRLAREARAVMTIASGQLSERIEYLRRWVDEQRVLIQSHYDYGS